MFQGLTKFMLEEVEMVNEVFDLKNAKGYDFTVTPNSETPGYTKYEATFEPSPGKVFAFRVNEAKEYGKLTRRISIGEKSKSKMVKRLNVSKGELKTMLVTFLRCYEDYKENVNEGKLVGSYAIQLQDGVNKYVQFIYKVLARAFRSQPKKKLELVGVVEDYKFGGMLLMMINPGSPSVKFGGKDYDETEFTTNSPTYQSLMKLKPVVEPDVNKPDVPKADPTDTNTVAKVAPDPLNPDGIPGLNDPAKLNKEFFEAALSAPSREALDRVFHQYKIHRRYFAANIDKIEKNPPDYSKVFNDSTVAGFESAAGFYIKRSNMSLFKQMVSTIFSMSKIAQSKEDIVEYTLDGKVDVEFNSSTIKYMIFRQFMNEYVDMTKNEFDTVKYKQLIAMNAFDLYYFERTYMTYITATEEDKTLMRVVAAISTPDRLNVFVPIIQNSSEWINPVLKDGKIICAVKYDKDMAHEVKRVNDLIKVVNKFDPTSDVVKVIDPYTKSPNTNFNEGEVILLSKNTFALRDRIASFLTSKNMGNGKGLQLLIDDFITLGINRPKDAALLGLSVSLDFSGYNPEYIENLNLANYSLTENDVREVLFKRDTYGITNTASPYIEGMINAGIKVSLDDVLSISKYGITYFDGLLSMLIDKFGIDSVVKGILKNGKVGAIVKGFPLPSLSVELIVDSFKILLTNLSRDNYRTMNTLVSSISRDQMQQAIESIANSSSIMDVNLLADDIAGTRNSTLSLMVLRLLQFMDPTVEVRDLENNLYRSSASTVEFLKSDIATDEDIIKTVKFNPEHALESITNILNSDDLERPKRLDDSMMKKIVKTVIDESHSNGSRYNGYYGDSSILGNLDGGMLALLDNETLDKLPEIFARIDITNKTTRRNVYTPILERMIDCISELDRIGKDDLVNRIIDGLSEKERRFILKYSAKGLMYNKYIKHIKENAQITPATNINKVAMSKILNINEVNMAKEPGVGAKDTFKTIKEKVAKVDLGFPDQQIDQIKMNDRELEDLTIEYDAFNARKHGLSVLFQEAYNVSIPSQIQGRAEWDAKMHDLGVNSKIMNPVFHGTGSVAASMILRMGFKVVDQALATKAGIKYAGRMLGDGVYFSTKMDKVAQYAADSGFNRNMGEIGYLFEMEASLGRPRVDYLAAGAPDDPANIRQTVSPEWAVYSPNQQLVIKKAYKVKRVPHRVISELKEKRRLREGANTTVIRGFRDVIKENLNIDTDQRYATFIFGDGMIPLADGTLVDFENIDKHTLPDSVMIDGGQLGAMVTFKRVPKDMNDGMFHVQIAQELVDQRNSDPVASDYFKLMKIA